MNKLVEHVVTSDILDDSSVTVADVGCSGGLHRMWFKFGKKLRAYGFDPLIHEIASLNNRVDSLFDVTYFPYFIGTNNSLCNKDDFNDALQKLRRVKIPGDMGKFLGVPLGTDNRALTRDRVSLDSFFASVDGTVDFIKTDTDGFDLDVLKSAQSMLSEKMVLGLRVEVQFNGSVNNFSNTFSNVDLYLRKNGFFLYNIEVQRTARKHLPAKSVSVSISENEKGQVSYADVYYFRDLCYPEYENKWNIKFPPISYIKLACLFELHNFHDCAAEILISKREYVKDIIDVDYCLDLLTQGFYGEIGTYREHLELFESSSEYFFPALKNILKTYGISYPEYVELIYSMNQIQLDIDALDCTGLSLVFYGAGGGLTSILPYLQDRLQTARSVHVCDSNPEKYGTSVLGFDVISPGAMLEIKPDLVVITSFYAKEIFLGLKKLQKESNVDFKIATLA